MKSTKKTMKEEYLINDPKTYGIVYKGSAKVINFQGQQMYFRSKDLAERFKAKAEPVFCDVELEVIQFNPTAEEKRNRAVARDLSHELLTRKKKSPKMAKNHYNKHSNWLSKLQQDRKEWAEYLKYQKKIEKKEMKLERIKRKKLTKEKDSEDYF
jgi:hypothetical protein